MKWVSADHDTSKEKFELWEDGKMLADISFSKQTRFVRMVSLLGKRMFSFENIGLFNPKKVIRNEYGVKLGKMEELKTNTGKGVIELEGKKYTFIYDRDNTGDLTLFDEVTKQNLLSCNFKAITNTLNKASSLLDSRFGSLLLLLCWYSFQSQHASVSKTF